MKSRLVDIEKFRDRRFIFADREEAGKVLVAIPTAPRRAIELILIKADRVYCANVRTASRFAVAEAYRNWYDLEEEEILKLMDTHHGDNGPMPRKDGTSSTPIEC